MQSFVSDQAVLTIDVWASGDYCCMAAYSVAEFAAVLGKAEFTVREQCRLGRIRASTRRCVRDTSQEWMVSHEELERVRNEGLLPDPARYRHVR